MTMDTCINKLREGRKVKARSWKSLIITGVFTHNDEEIITATDSKAMIYYFTVPEFRNRFSKIKNWKTVSSTEWKNFYEKLKMLK